MGRRRGDARDRSRQETLRRGFRQRPGQLRQPDESGGVSRALAARRHVHGPRSRRRRTSYPRLAGQHVRQMVQGLALHGAARSEEHTSELQSLAYLVCRLLLEKKKNACSEPRAKTIYNAMTATTQ